MRERMIDNLSLAISHGLMILAAWRLLWRRDLDDDSGDAGAGGFRKWRGASPDA